MNALDQRLFKNMIDYAGTFPPANLSIEDAIEEYFKERSENGSWIIKTLILPWTKISEFDKQIKKRNSENLIIRISVLLVSEDTQKEFLKKVEEQIRELRKFLNSNDEYQLVSLEIKLPKLDYIHGKINPNTIQVLSELLEVHNMNNVIMYLEGYLIKGWESILDPIFNYLQQSNAVHETIMGYKIRTGSIKPEEIPDISTLVNLLKMLTTHDIPFKATAGLHSPLRTNNRALDVFNHGFFNILMVSSILKANLTNDIKVLSEILEISQWEAFHFSEKYIEVRGFNISKKDLLEVRENQFLSFGSCSLREPLDDLQREF